MNQERVHDIGLVDLDGMPTTLGEFAADHLVVVLVRYFGCLPCQHYLRDLEVAREELPGDSRVVAVGGSSASQARWLRDVKGIEMPLLLDSDHRLRAVAELGTLSMRQLSKGDGWKNYARALRNGFRPQVPTQDMTQAPGIVVFDQDFSIEWVHRGEMMGDYPPLDELLTRLRSLAANR